MEHTTPSEQYKVWQRENLVTLYEQIHHKWKNGQMDCERGAAVLKKIRDVIICKVKPATMALPIGPIAPRALLSAPTALFNLDGERSLPPGVAPGLLSEAHMRFQTKLPPRPSTAPSLQGAEVAALKLLQEEVSRVEKLPSEQRHKILVAALLSQQGSPPAPNLQNLFAPPVALLHQWQVPPPPWGASPLSPFDNPQLGIHTLQLQTMLHALGKQPLQSKSSSESLLVNGPAGGAAARTSAPELVPDDNTSETHTNDAQDDRDMETLEGAEAILCLRNSSPSSDIPTRARSHRPRKTQAMLKPVARRPGQGKRNAEGPGDAPIPKRARSARGPH
eukprot:jgi/Botrbrau1/21277/Bobra.39_2s0066.1